MKTYRYRGHSRTDPAKYRPEGELEAWKQRDPIDLLGAKLAAEGVVSDDDAARSAHERGPGRGRRERPRAPPRRPSRRSRRSRPMSTHLELSPPPAEADVVELTYREAISAALADELAATTRPCC